MRSVVIASLLFGVGTAHADPDYVPVDTVCACYFPQRYQQPQGTSGMFVDFGAGVQRLAPGDGNTYSANVVRFSPQATFGQHFYLGAELAVGSFDVSASNNTISRDTAGLSNVPLMTITSGTLVSVKAVAGLRASAGIVTGGVELAGGVRWTRTQDVNGTSIGDDGQGLVEARGRLDVWLGDTFTLGGIVGKDLTNTNDMMVGLQLGLHFERYRH